LRVDSITYPKVLYSISEELAIVRSNLSSNIYSKGTARYRGKSENYTSTMGIFGELIARHYLEENNINFVGASLIEKRPVAEPDILINENSIDVKCSLSKNLLSVNKKSHHNENKRPNEYWFVKPNIDKGEAIIYKVYSIDVDNWKVEVHPKYKDEYYKEEVRLKLDQVHWSIEPIARKL
jgi:hypothetical protein